MKVIVPKYTELIASNVGETTHSLWATGTEYNAGQKVNEYYSDFPELVSFGNCLFDNFTKGDGWTYNGTESRYECDGSQTAVSTLYQNNLSTPRTGQYLITYQVVARSAGTIYPYIHDVEGTAKNAAGWYQEVITVSAATIKTGIGLRADADFVGSVSNISIKRVGAIAPRNIYECLDNAVTGTLPSQSDDWVKVSASNRWKMFDDYMASQSERDENITVKIKANRCDTFAFFVSESTDVSYHMMDDAFTETSITSIAVGTGSKSFTMTTSHTVWAKDVMVEIYKTSAPETFMFGTITAFAAGSVTVDVTKFDGSGTHSDWSIVVSYKSESQSNFLSKSMTWLEYFFSPISYSTSKSFNFPIGLNSSLRISFTGLGLVKVGHLVAGWGKVLGKTQYGVRGGITSFSVKQANEFGEYSLTKRSSANELRFTVLVPTGGEDTVHQTLKQLDAVPCVWDANEPDTDYSMAVIYGFFSDFEVIMPGYNHSECELEIQGLT